MNQGLKGHRTAVTKKSPIHRIYPLSLYISNSAPMKNHLSLSTELFSPSLPHPSPRTISVLITIDKNWFFMQVKCFMQWTLTGYSISLCVHKIEIVFSPSAMKN